MNEEAFFQEIKRLNLIVGMQCNVRCSMCFLDGHDPRDTMPSVIYQKHLLPLYPFVRCIKVQGGEPTIMSRTKEIVRFLERFPHIRFEFYSNGVYVDSFWENVFREKTEYLNVSVNAATRRTYERIVRHGDFDKVCRHISTIAKTPGVQRPRIAISAVILKHNIHELPEFVRLGREVGADIVTFFLDPFLSFVGVSKKEIRGALDKVYAEAEHTGIQLKGVDVVEAYVSPRQGLHHVRMKKKPCDRPFINLMVDYVGDVRICSLAWRVIGNTYKSSLKEILGHRQRATYKKKMTRGDYSWCAPHCLESPCPGPRVPWDKYVYLAFSNPRELMAYAAHRVNRKVLIQASSGE